MKKIHFLGGIMNYRIWTKLPFIAVLFIFSYITPTKAESFTEFLSMSQQVEKYVQEFKIDSKKFFTMPACDLCKVLRDVKSYTKNHTSSSANTDDMIIKLAPQVLDYYTDVLIKSSQTVNIKEIDILKTPTIKFLIENHRNKNADKYAYEALYSYVNKQIETAAENLVVGLKGLLGLFFLGGLLLKQTQE